MQGKFFFFNYKMYFKAVVFMFVSVFILFPSFFSSFSVRENRKKNCFKTCLMTPSTLGDNQWHVGLMWWLTGFPNPGGQWVHLQTRLREKPFASQLMQTGLTRRLCPNVSPQVKMCERQFFIRSTWARPWVWSTLLDVKESTPVPFLSHCIRLQPRCYSIQKPSN